MLNIKELTVKKAKELIDKKEIEPKELVEASYDRIKKADDKVEAFNTILEQNDIMAQLDSAKKGNLYGLPYSLKDNICTKDILTTCSSKILYNYRPPFNATVAEKLKNSGGVLMGKTSMDEFAMGSSNENAAFKQTKNPWDLTRVPGGSSGGPAASVASGEVLFALGSDTGGSIRQPASLCGLVGLKPTYGLVSRYGLVAFGSSLDQIGPLTKTVEDAAIVLNEIAGHDPKDSTSADKTKTDYTKCLTGDIIGKKIAMPRQFFSKDLNKEIRDSIETAIKKMEDLGAIVEEVDISFVDYVISTYYIISSAEAASNLARYDGVRYGLRAENTNGIVDMFTKTRSEGFGKEVKRRIMLGNYVLSAGYYDAYYLKALKARTVIKREFDEIFKNFDVIVSPTYISTAFRFGEKSASPMEMYLSDIYTVPINIAGLPGISIPCGLDAKGLPIGMQLIGKPFGEEDILSMAYAYEKETGNENLVPEILGVDR